MSIPKDSFLGCVVNKKNGGPLMTISEMASANTAVCLWFSDDELFSGLFDLRELTAWQEVKLG